MYETDLLFFFFHFSIWSALPQGAPVFLPFSLLFLLGHVLLTIPPGDWSDSRGLFNPCFFPASFHRVLFGICVCVYIPIGAELRPGRENRISVMVDMTASVDFRITSQHDDATLYVRCPRPSGIKPREGGDKRCGYRLTALLSNRSLAHRLVSQSVSRSAAHLRIPFSSPISGVCWFPVSMSGRTYLMC